MKITENIYTGLINKGNILAHLKTSEEEQVSGKVQRSSVYSCTVYALLKGAWARKQVGTGSSSQFTCPGMELGLPGGRDAVYSHKGASVSKAMLLQTGLFQFIHPEVL